MLASPTDFGIHPTSSGRLPLLQLRTEHVTSGSVSVEKNLEQLPAWIPLRELVGTIGSRVGLYFQDLVVTASAHTVYNIHSLPVAYENESIYLVETGNSSVSQLSAVLKDIQALTGLNKTRIAVDLFGVTKQAFNAWERGLKISNQNLNHVLETHDVLRRANLRHPGPDQLQTWLSAPRGIRAERPRDLLKQGEFGRARLLAISTAPPRESPVSDWVLRSSPDPWTSEQMRWGSRIAAEDQSELVDFDG